ncbi:MAG: pre-mycofactocin synthase MftD [Gemmatimonadaceae bacterium]
MASGWFESVAEAERRARRVLPRSVYKAILAGTERGLTLTDNVAAFSELGFAPHVAGLTGDREQSTTVMGQAISLPVVISPVGVQAVHPEAERAVARAAAARGTAMGLSGFASTPVEEIVAVNPKTFSQLYWAGPREAIAARVERAGAAGVAGLIVTLDWTYAHARDWGSPTIPSALDLRTMARFAPEVLLRPVWMARWAKSGRAPALEVPNMVAAGALPPAFFAAYGEWMQTPPPSWEDLRWLRSLWDGPFMLKGVIRVDDARRAVEECGFTALSVSNHGGNNMDGTPASIRAVAAVAEAVGDRAEILLDGGIRRGGDVVKALALGARAVMIGRAYLWGLAANGQAGVENVLDILRSGIDSALLGLGHASIHELTPDDVVIPRDFARRLGAG